MRGEGGVVAGHVFHAVGEMDLLVVADAEPHGPQRSVVAGGGKAEVELPQREVGFHRFIDLLQRDRFQRREHLAKFPRHIPPHAELLQIATHRVETAPLVEAPDFEALVLSGHRTVRFSGVAGEFQAVLIQAARRHSIWCTDDLLPLGLGTRNIAIIPCPRFGRHEIRVITDEREPVRPRGDAIRTVLQPIRLHGRMRAGSDEHFHRLARRLGDNGQSRAADFFDRAAKLLRSDPHHARGFVTDDNLRPRLTILDKIRFCECAVSDEEREDECESVFQDHGLHCLRALFTASMK